MPAFQINDEEWSALVEEPGDIFLTYCAIRRVMDFRTGIAGRVRRISEQMLSEVLYVAPCRGRHESGSPTRQRVRSTVSRLIALGVLVQIGPMVFELPLANADLASKRSATDEQPDQQPDQQPTNNQPETSNEGALSDSPDESATVSASADLLNSNLPPISDLPPTTLLACEPAAPEPGPRQTEFVPKRFAMHDDWQPTNKGWGATTARNGIPSDALNAEVLGEFRSYWINRPEKHQSQGQWEHELAQSVKRAYLKSGRTPNGQAQRTSGSQSPYRQGSRSAVDRVRNSIRERRAREAAAGSPGDNLAEDGGNVRAPLDGEFRRIS